MSEQDQDGLVFELALVAIDVGRVHEAVKREGTASRRSAEALHPLELSLLKSGRYDLAEQDISALEQAADGHILKVIIEVPLLTAQEIVIASLIAEAAGADYIKTSTGFKHLKGWRPSTVEDIAQIRGVVGNRVKVKVAGGVSTLSQALAMLTAGASRIGTSQGCQIMRQYRAAQAGLPI